MAKAIQGNVILENLHLKEIPDILDGLTVKGSLYLSHNRLTSLNNCPVNVEYKFEILISIGFCA